jgi:hypothetical protein
MVWTVVCMLIYTFVYGGMEGCMYVNMYIGIWWSGRFYGEYVHWYPVVWTVVYMLICTLVSVGMDRCMYVNMYIGIWWYGRMYV